ncbi:hypothetical protein GQF03_04980 [Sneathiella chungangensis]|uniref:Glycosyltransferase RgtA/B/C/D-like domain-containing protein n=1 Tax=Sneathiella chungangensis TaxID=1418234 RepID=A0A845MDB1_9PROT|nr:hypothetical protein [Sneathiella chungangensis]MZR21675.1 hypothetical protein [Sneathiella chungangensis]
MIDQFSIRTANTVAASIFTFAALLLIANRLPVQGVLSAAIIVPISAGVTLLLVFASDGWRSTRVALYALLAFFAVLAIWAFGTQSLYPVGHDGYVYHLPAIWDLAAGWHPFFTPHNNIWIDSYPTGYWALQSYIVATTGLPFAGLALLGGLAIFVGLQAFAFFNGRLSSQRPRVRFVAALIIAGLVIANPVVLIQIQTHYVDAPLYIVGTAIVFFMLTDAIEPNRLAKWGVCGGIILFLNIKTSALYFGPLIIFGGFVMELILNKANLRLFPRVIDWFKSKGILYAAAGIFAIVAIGYKPYVTNILDHGALLYPQSDEIMDGNTPMNVKGPMPAPMKFLYGVFAKTEDNLWGVPTEEEIHLKFPGTFQIKEFIAPYFDIRRGGFGPFFSLALILSLISYAACRIVARNTELYSWSREGDAIAGLGGVLLVSSMFFPESWWARYIPFAWLSCIFFVLPAFYLKGAKKSVVIVRTLSVIAVLSLIGCVLSGGLGALRQHYHSYNRTLPIDVMEEYSVVELTLVKDIRVFQDYQSKSQSDAVAVWASILQRRGVNTIEQPNFNHEKCLLDGYFLGGVIWCVPKEATKKSGTTAE